MSDPTRTSTHTVITFAIRTTRKGRCTICGRKCQQTHGFGIDLGGDPEGAQTIFAVGDLKDLLERWEDENPYITCARCLAAL